MSTFWAIVLGLFAFGVCFWLMGRTRSVRKETVADMTVARQKEITDAKSKEAEIYARPAGSKSDIIGRL